MSKVDKLVYSCIIYSYLVCTTLNYFFPKYAITRQHLNLKYQQVTINEIRKLDKLEVEMYGRFSVKSGIV